MHVPWLVTGIPYEGTRLSKLNVDLGQITEMIHVASLIHDDVLDEAETRRGGLAVHTRYTNKVAGDYLLAKASVLLARLQHFQVVRFFYLTLIDKLSHAVTINHPLLQHLLHTLLPLVNLVPPHPHPHPRSPPHPLTPLL